MSESEASPARELVEQLEVVRCDRRWWTVPPVQGDPRRRSRGRASEETRRGRSESGGQDAIWEQALLTRPLSKCPRVGSPCPEKRPTYPPEKANPPAGRQGLRGGAHRLTSPLS